MAQLVVARDIGTTPLLILQGRSPFEALYGYPPRHFGVVSPAEIQSSELSSWLTDRPVMTDLVRQHLLRAKLRMKKQADKGRSERQFAVGDLVFLKLQPYVQPSLAPRANMKPAFKFFGPYKVLARVGSVAYKLDLPVHSSIHPVFHVSQLKPAMLPTDKVLAPVPNDIELLRVPEEILQNHSLLVCTRMVDQVLVKWSGWPRSLATWEDRTALQQHFPAAAAWGQVASQDRGGVTAATTTGPRTSARPRRLSTKVYGPNWVHSLAREWGVAHVMRV